MREIEQFMIAAFRHDEKHTVAYESRKTLDALLRRIKRVIEDTDCDYISLRVIRKERDD